MASYLFIQREIFESDWLKLLSMKLEIRINFYPHTIDKFMLQILLTKRS